MIGRLIGNYKILEKLGGDKTAEVYKAVDVLLDRNVVIKILERSVSDQKEIAERFRDEAAILAKLDHKAVPRLHTLTETADELLMILEFSDGETLKRILQREGKFSLAKAGCVFAQILDCLEFCHKNGVAHGALDNSKILFTDAGKLKILGFGESEKNGETNTKESDIYALAAMLYGSLLGKSAFSAETQFDRNIPDLIESVIKKALFDFNGKFKSVAEFRCELELAGLEFTEKAEKTAKPAAVENVQTIAKKSVHKRAEKREISRESVQPNKSEMPQNQPTRAIGQKRYYIAGASILAVLVLHFAWQFSFVQKQNLRAAENSVEAIQTDERKLEAKSDGSVVASKTIKPKVDTKPDYAVADSGAIRSTKSAQKTNYGKAEVKSAPRPEKKAVRESSAERLRRAEKMLTGM